MSIKRVIDSLFIGKAVQSYNQQQEEDGGPGSGNWGHKGRQGLRGGSGKGGGKQYRGGHAASGNYYSSKKDWLNGLNGESQVKAQNLVKKYGKTVAEAEKNILTSGNRSDIIEMLSAKAEARKWDTKAKELMDNLDGQDRDLMSYFSGMAGLDLKDMFNLAESDEEKAYFANMFNKALGGEDNGAEAPDSLLIKAGLKEPEKTVKEYDTSWARNLLGVEQFGIEMLAEQFGIDYDFKTNNYEAIQKIENALGENGFADQKTMKCVQGYLKVKGSNGYKFKTNIFSQDTPEFNRMRELLEAANSQSYYGDEASGQLIDEESYLNKMSVADAQEYLSLKSQVLGGPEIARTFQKRTPAEAASYLLNATDNISTYKDVEKALYESDAFPYGASFNLEGIDVQALDSVLGGYSDVLKSYPFMQHKMYGVDTKINRRNAYASCSWKTGGKIHLNLAYYSDATKLRMMYDHDVALGYHCQGTDFNSIVVHEIGHAVDGYLQSLGIAGTKTDRRSFWTPVEVNKDPSDYLVSKVAKGLGTTINTLMKGGMVSGQAGQDRAEWFAESFSELLCSKFPRPAAVEFGTQFEKLLKESGLR